jgi:hypothetical protein
MLLRSDCKMRLYSDCKTIAAIARRSQSCEVLSHNDYAIYREEIKQSDAIKDRNTSVTQQKEKEMRIREEKQRTRVVFSNLVIMSLFSSVSFGRP